MTTTETRTTQVYRVWIRSTPEAVWKAITDPEWNGRYGYCMPADYSPLAPGGRYSVLGSEEMRAVGGGESVIDGEILECDPPRRLVQTWHAIFEPTSAAEPPTRVTWEIEQEPSGLVRLTLTHDVTDAPATAVAVSGEIPEAGGGWGFILSDLKTMLESGKAFQES